MPHKRKPKALRRLGPPPGLEEQDEKCNVDSEQFVGLARRVQRLELLLFRLPTPNFERMDRELMKLLHQEQPVEEEVSSVDLLNVSCPVFDLTASHPESEEGADTLEGLTCVLEETKLDILESRCNDLLDSMQTVEKRVSEMEAGRSAQNLVDAVTQVVQSKYEILGDAIITLRQSDADLEKKFERCLSMLEEIHSQSRHSTSTSDDTPETKGPKKKRK